MDQCFPFGKFLDQNEREVLCSSCEGQGGIERGDPDRNWWDACVDCDGTGLIVRMTAPAGPADLNSPAFIGGSIQDDES